VCMARWSDRRLFRLGRRGFASSIKVGNSEKRSFYGPQMEFAPVGVPAERKGNRSGLTHIPCLCRLFAGNGKLVNRRFDVSFRREIMRQATFWDICWMGRCDYR